MASTWIALTGTPGTGKTSVARLLRASGVRVLDGRRLALRAHAIVGMDHKRGSRIVEPRRIARHLLREGPPEGTVLVDSHWSHEIPGIHAAIVLRLRPVQLRRRLARRRWPRRKVDENVEAEGMDLILSEAARALPTRRVAELDMTRLTTPGAVRRLLPFIEHPDSRLTNLEIGRVDWTRDFLEWSLTATAASSTRS